MRCDITPTHLSRDFYFILVELRHGDRADLVLFGSLATDKRFLESEDKLRCAAIELSVDYLRYGAFGQEELDNPYSKW